MTENDYLDQIRFRVQTAERRFHDGVRALHGSRAAEGTLRSGGTIAITLRLFEDEFGKLTDEIIAYLIKTIQRTKLDRATLLTLTSQLLTQSKLTFDSMLDREKLLKFAPGRRVGMVIDEAVVRASARLTLKLREFAFGLDDGARERGVPEVSGVTGKMNSREFRERVLIALYRRAMRDGVQNSYDPKDVCERAGLTWKVGQLRAVMVRLEQSGLVELSQLLSDDDNGMDAQLTQNGIEEAENLIEQNIEYEEDEGETYADASLVPASNRYVEISDNQRKQIGIELGELKEALRGDNEVDDEDRQIFLSEIAVFEATIGAPRVSTELVNRFVQEVLRKIVSLLPAAIFGALTERIINTLSSIF
ncbi:hypothetical protein [Terricaulis sp.]|uniref:hypothetical protein n=1 Tax=Terricaulis sp. TaxID=2768686 RepID=UPI002AC55A50|nr:hypothetical protein [Terricaulis sp.]MDZ4690731.1 hypothetical protein [Terricaulis sp.]